MARDVTRDDVIGAVEAYLRGLAAKDLSAAPLHPDVEWHGPPGTWIKGASMLRVTLAGVFPAINDIHIIRHTVDGEWCATMFNLEIASGTLPVFDCFHVVGGQIVSIHDYAQPTLKAPSRGVASPPASARSERF